MCTKQWFGRLVFATAALLVMVVAGSAQVKLQTEDSASDRLNSAISASQSLDRAIWYPAARQLGALAAADPAKRTLIWENAAINTLGMKFKKIAPGAFLMGSPPASPMGLTPAHRVEITEFYYMSVTEVTNKQCVTVLADFACNAHSPEPEMPATGVSWALATEFCEELSRREGATYRLPTEAEWEYACRAGSTSKYCFGDDDAQLMEFAWWRPTASVAANVSSFRPNAWGLFDMHGNAAEWVSDWMRSDTYLLRSTVEGRIRDPVGPPSGAHHVIRGGSWIIPNSAAFESANRFSVAPLERPILAFLLGPRDSPGFSDTIGFRVVRVVQR